MKWAIGGATVFALAFGLLVYWLWAVYLPENAAACYAAGGDRFISTRDGLTCWREDGTRIWLD